MKIVVIVCGALHRILVLSSQFAEFLATKACLAEISAERTHAKADLQHASDIARRASASAKVLSKAAVAANADATAAWDVVRQKSERLASL